jgi:TPR repeat protein
VKLVFHGYRSGHLAVEILEDFRSDAVFTEVLLFSLMVSRSLLKFKEKGKDVRQLISWLNSFGEMAAGIHKGTLSVAGVRQAVNDNPWGVEFNRVPGNAQIIATLTIRTPNVVDYRFHIDEKGWFGLFGVSKHLAYGSAMVALRWFLMNKRIEDLRYAEALNAAGYLIGKAFFDNQLSLQNEVVVMERTIQEVISAVNSGEQNQDRWFDPGELSDYSVNVEKLLDSAGAGDVKAQYFVGMLYKQGIAVLQDFHEAAKWFKSAAELGGDPAAQFQLADMYLFGKGVSQDYSEAEKWYLRGAEKGDVGSQAMLGTMYLHGLGCTQNYSQAMLWCGRAAEKGSEEAQTQLGLMYWNGLGVQQDYATAVRWYREAAEQGYAMAQHHLATAYQEGLGVEQDYGEAVAWYKKAAEQGVSAAKYSLGYMITHGLGVPEDFHEGLRFVTEAAVEGHAQAQYSLGTVYEKLGKRDDALKWYRTAAENGHTKAGQRLKELL